MELELEGCWSHSVAPGGMPRVLRAHRGGSEGGRRYALRLPTSAALRWRVRRPRAAGRPSLFALLCLNYGAVMSAKCSIVSRGHESNNMHPSARPWLAMARRSRDAMGWMGAVRAWGQGAEGEDRSHG